MADAKLTPRQLVDVLHRLDAIESNAKQVRAHLINSMASRRTRENGDSTRALAPRTVPPRDGAPKRRRD
jgi:hypothetical protein